MIGGLLSAFAEEIIALQHQRAFRPKLTGEPQPMIGGMLSAFAEVIIALQQQRAFRPNATVMRTIGRAGDNTHPAHLLPYQSVVGHAITASQFAEVDSGCELTAVEG